MKKIAVFLLLLACWGCKENESTFDFPTSSVDFKFTPIAGGTVIHYKLPANGDIYAVEARCKDYTGKEVVTSGTYANDSLVIKGFAEARKNIPISITLINFKKGKSAPITLTFDTEDSAPIAFFNGVQVKPHWDGFQVITNNPKYSNGLAHIFYLGTNPLNGLIDTLEVKTMPITPGRDTLAFSLQQKRDFNTVIIRTEDVRGFRVKQVEYKDVEAYTMRKAVWKDEFEFLDTKNLSIEDDEYMLGIKYLFDGDTKGLNSYLNGDPKLGYLKPCTFLAGPGAVGAPFIVELKQPAVPASCRFYAILTTNYIWPESNANLKYTPIWNNMYITKLACKMFIYASNDKDDDSSWVQIAKYEQDYKTLNANRWCFKAYDFDGRLKSAQAIEDADPCYLDMTFAAGETPYRYLKILVTDVYTNTLNSTGKDINPARYITFHELEVYVKK